MAFSPGIQDRSGEFIALGLNNFAQGISQGMKSMGETKGQAKRIRSALSAMNPDGKENYENMGLGELQGELDGIALNRAQEIHDLRLKEFQRQEEQYLAGQKAMELFFDNQQPSLPMNERMSRIAQTPGIGINTVIGLQNFADQQSRRGIQTHQLPDGRTATLYNGQMDISERSPYGNASGVAPLSKEQIVARDAINKEFLKDPIIDRYRQSRVQYENIQKLADSMGTGQKDLGMVFAFMKSLDPESVVREGERASAENTGGVPQAVWRFYNKLVDGETISPKERLKFVMASKTAVEGNLPGMSRAVDHYKKRLGGFGIPSDDNIFSELPEGNFIPAFYKGARMIDNDDEIEELQAGTAVYDIRDQKLKWVEDREE